MSVERSVPKGAVFLSYASQDAEAAKRICEALRVAGVEVWFDQSELRGGDAWDQKIRKQIRECALFVPVISANTQARLEGYFRLEWRLAEQRTHLMAKGKPFLVPVVIDETSDSGAFVPEAFVEVQWTRLASGESLSGFCERVQTLLASATAHATAAPFHRGGGEAGATPSMPSRTARTRRLAWALAAIVLVAAAIWQPWRTVAPAAPTPPGAAASETRPLAQRARALFEKIDSTRDDFAAAEDLLKQAIARDGTDAESWAAQAELNSGQTVRGFDVSDARREAARAAAQRALGLDPKSFEARFALTSLTAANARELQEKEVRLRELQRERPADQRVLRRLAEQVRLLGRLDEANALLDQSAALPGGDALALYAKAGNLLNVARAAEAEAALRASLARRPFSSSLLLSANVALTVRGDFAAARAAVEQLPAAMLREDRACFTVFRLHLWQRDFDAAIAVLRALPRDWLNDNAYRGPKGLLVGDLLALSSRAEAAGVEWRAALKLVDARLATNPNDFVALLSRPVLLVRAGEREAAEQALTVVRQLTGWGRAPDTERPISGSYIYAHLLLGQRTEAIRLIRLALKSDNRFFAGWTSWALRLDPRWDPLREEPEFKTAIAEAELAEKLSAGSSAPAAADPAAQKSVAVLAFANLSDDKENEYFSDGISEELLNVLAKVPGLRVAARTSAFYFKGRNATAQEIGQKLGVAHLVEGSVRRAGARVRIAARLSRAETGEQLWSESYDRELKDIFALQDEISRDIAAKLQLTLSGAARRASAVNPEAHRLVLEGRHFWNLRTEDGFERADTAFRQALALDPQFAQAHAGLADVSVMRATYRILDGETEVADDIVRTREEVAGALALDSSLAEPHAALAFALHLERKLPEAELEYQKAFALNPNYAVAHMWRGVTKLYEGRIDTMLEELEKATALDPLSFINVQIWSEALALAGRVDEALAMNARAAALRSDVWPPNRGEQAALLWRKGRADEAVAAARSTRQLWPRKPRYFADGYAIWVLQQAGQRKEAADYAAQLLKDLPETNSHRGFVLAAVGRFSEAVPYLERSGVMSNRSLFWAPMWDAYRNDPRFQQLMVKLGCANEYKVARDTLARMLKESAVAEPSTSAKPSTFAKPTADETADGMAARQGAKK